MVVPGISDLLLVSLHRLFEAAQFGVAETIASRELDGGLQPELRLAVSLSLSVSDGSAMFRSWKNNVR
jgi:hypothetical protein